MLKLNNFFTVASGLLGATVAILSMFGCDNESPYDEQYGMIFGGAIHETKSSQYYDYLTVSSYETEKWSNIDYDNCSRAIQRIGVIYSESNNKYVVAESDYCSIGISDTLYLVIAQMIERTNTIFQELSSITKPRVLRLKKRSAEHGGSNTLPDCVPAAVSHMGCINAPSYDDAILKCDELFPGWRTNGGMPLTDVERYIENYIQVTEYSDLSCFSSGDNSTPNYVMIFGTHAVNAYRVFNQSASVIYYHDFSSSSIGDSFILGSEMTHIYVFN